jgi:glycosyltransferase involved in cell wall biosynthesis
MRIAQVAPLAESVPPILYGGTERIVSYLTEEQVRRGNKVTLFAAGDSQTKARLIRCTQCALRLDATVTDAMPHHFVMLDYVREYARDFDILHFHIDMMHYPLLRALNVSAVTTLHGRLDLPDLRAFYLRFPDVPLVSISDAQRWPMPPVAWMRTVYHGLPRSLLLPKTRPEGYLAFLGRISPEKRPDRAIEIAARAGMPLKIAAKIDRVDQDYWHDEIEPLVRREPLVEYVGEIGEYEKAEFLGNAAALVFPIDWPEPFGLVMIEAMACGTPVIAFACGSVPEVIDPGVTGFLVASVDEAVDAVGRASTLDRRVVRETFERRFSVERMADDYEAVYGAIIEARRVKRQRARPALPLTAWPDR